MTASLRWTSVEELPTTASRRTGITPRTRGYSLRTDGRPPTPGAPSGPITARINPRPRRPVMGTIVISGTVVLVVLGFDNHLYWLAAVAVLFLYVQYGRGGSSPSSPTGGSSAGPTPASYRAYRDRRDKQARWERRYRRERPFESRRQEREKSK
ncbi:hypothetical protein GCM10022232_35950 [Streptomyces plumbiresistens]|uniref:Integral membrane protein n=2 Tax=Streptomyces TaxID=1883 RepID=A0ABP7RDZ4_9ACTN